MAANHKKEQRAELERNVWLLRQRGRTEQSIATELGIGQATVSRMLARVEERLAGEFKDTAERIKARQATVLEHIAEEALMAWEKSLEDAEEITETGGRSVVRGRGAEAKLFELPGERTVKRYGQSGNPALLAQAMNAYAGIRAIYGLDAPKRQDITSGGESWYKLYTGFNPEDDGGEREPVAEPAREGDTGG